MITHVFVRQASSAADDPCSAALSLRPGRSHSALITQRRYSAVLGLQLGMDVRWPLSIVISQVCSPGPHALPMPPLS